MSDLQRIGPVGPVFIVGMPRSGTKLLRGLLNQCAGIRILNSETNFFPFLVRWVQDHGEPRTDTDFASLYEALQDTPYFAYRGELAPFSPQQWRRWCERYDAAGLFEGFVRYETGTPRDAQVLCGDKSPGYIRHIDLLLQHFPRGRVIHIVRDVRDYCASIRKAWSKDVRRAAYQWGRDVASAHRSCEARPGQCIEIKYESLLRSPDTEMHRLCEFLDLAFSPAMTHLGRPTEPQGDAIGQTQIVRDNFGKYPQRLTAREIRDIEALAFDTMKLLGLEPAYATRQRAMHGVEQRLRRMKDGLHLVSRGATKLGVVGALRFHLAHRRVVH